MSKIIGDTACPGCRAQGKDKTGDHLMLFEDGGGYCNRCDKYYDVNILTGETKIKEEQAVEKVSKPSGGEIRALEDRGITQEIAEVYGVYSTSEKHWYPRTVDGEIVGFKVRNIADKEFFMEGSGKTNEFFGHHLLGPGGRKVFITEGECDAMALAQALTEGMDDKAKQSFGFPPVVSVPNGVSSASSIFAAHHDKLSAFNEIILVPDADPMGKELVDAAIEAFGRDKLKVVTLPYKDPNDMVLKGMSTMLRICDLSRGKPPTPEEVVFLDDISLEDLKKPIPTGLDIIQYPDLCRKLHGFRYGSGAGELTVVVSGSGMGKSTLTKEFIYSLRVQHDLTVGEIRLEEGTIKTAQSLVAIHNNVPVAALRENPNIIPDEAWEESLRVIRGNHQVAMLDHFGSLASEKLIDHLKYLAYTVGCDFIGLDHISMVISGQKSSNERKDIDLLMTELAAFVESSGVSVIAVVHLRRPPNDLSWNDGAEVALSMLRGSAALEQLSHNVLAIEGNQREGDGNKRKLHVLKNREWGSIGFGETLNYYPTTGRLLGINSEVKQ